MLRMRTIWSWWEFCAAPTSSGFVVTEELEEAFFSSYLFLFYYFLLFMLNLELQVKNFFFMFIPQVYWPESDQDVHGNICISSPNSRVP